MLSADRIASARLSDTGDEVHVVLLDHEGRETVLSLPAAQLGLLAGWLEQVATRLDSVPPPEENTKRLPPVFPIEWWTVRPEPDEEHLVLGFRMAKGMELALRMHRNAAASYVQALSSLLGNHLPAAPPKARH